jgi:hypothetical protein
MGIASYPTMSVVGTTFPVPTEQYRYRAASIAKELPTDRTFQMDLISSATKFAFAFFYFPLFLTLSVLHSPV